MLIVVIAYLYVILMVSIAAIASGHLMSGIFTLLFAGILPSFLLLRIQLLKRRRAMADLAEAANAANEALQSASTDTPSQPG
ncbi:hypothetical protein [Chitinimonas sp. BJYL2]|uniref:hypothetical protein n=1 Tax=Chitinimonas sp. BJYL2 TaxID=2976696 RepID=UPI0022B4E5C9|nr:hypothetical protein [Chitinimonas sp. BJYL2]